MSSVQRELGPSKFHIHLQFYDWEYNGLNLPPQSPPPNPNKAKRTKVEEDRKYAGSNTLKSSLNSSSYSSSALVH